MKTRCVFSTNDLPAARAAMAAAREAGVDDRDISLVAREDIELEKIPDHLMQGRNDFYPAAVRGGVCGGGTGLLLGLAAAAVPPLGVTLGAAFGTCIGEIVGFEVPDTVSRKFSDEIAAGRILVVIDARREQLDAAEPAVLRTGARELPFHAHTALT
ncbi:MULTISPECIES: hypothetical protein [Rhodanobacter]|uniref:hypothetical protein n=1 Tax=Rhodanobacter TaxID=75309 RepID=UPI00041BD8C2|nr:MULTISPECIES: hypothetical protein [Rhodanobacter]TAN19237.1 MAG: hypothetical protein EPN35_01290 [Rhodanobacter sp.]UJJ53871.1 hypothetical protein LRK53_12980 [Rhodanobacter thiooxydans]